MNSIEDARDRSVDEARDFITRTIDRLKDGVTPPSINTAEETVRIFSTAMAEATGARLTVSMLRRAADLLADEYEFKAD